MMSYNPDPKWTEDISIPDVTEFVCPNCKVASRNESCTNYGYEFEYKLHVVITAVPLIELRSV